METRVVVLSDGQSVPHVYIQLKGERIEEVA